jgi:hypothetical protein
MHLLPLDLQLLLMFAIIQLSQPILMLQVLLHVSLSEVSPELGPPPMIAETAFLEFKPLPSKIPLLLLPALTQSVFSHQMDNIIASIPPVLTSYTILMHALLLDTNTMVIAKIQLVLLMDVS